LHYSNALLPVKVSAIWEIFKKWLLIIYIANNLNNNKIIYLVIGSLLLSGLCQSLIGTGQYIKGGPLGLGMLGEIYDELYLEVQAGIRRSSGTLGQPNQLALFLGPLLQLNLSYFFARFPNDSKWYLRWMYILPFVPMLFTLFVSYSRSGWFSFLIGGAINASWCLSLRTGKKLFSVFIVFGFFIVFATMAFVLSESIRNRLLMEDKGASEVRKPLEEIAKNIICHNPWFGVGLTDYQAVVYQYDNTQSWVSSEIFFETVHNEFLLVAAEQGIPVLLLFIYLIAWALITLWKISRTHVDPFIPYIAIGFFCGLISWMIHSQKDYHYVFFTTRFWFHIGIIYAMKYFIAHKEKTLSFG
jgi:O-antigen ligase